MKLKLAGRLDFRPTPGYLIIEPEAAEKKTASGIVLPESHEEKPQKGKVLAVGAAEVCDCDCKDCKKHSPCKVGETVVYKQWGGNEVKIDGKEYLFVKFEDILAVEG